MAEGQSYSGNANAAAATTSSCAAGKCPNCDKQGLAVLLTIPTLADTDYANGVHGTIAPLLEGTADPALTASGYVMRTLREGYVMAYYENHNLSSEIAAQRGWSLTRVHQGGYLTPSRFAVTDTPDIADEQPFSCSRVAGYASALLFTIPKAERAGKVWVAFSSHPWSENVRKAYAGNAEMRDRYMTRIDATAGTCARAIPLTTENLRKAVVDFVPQFDRKHLRGNPWPLRRLAADDAGVSRVLRERFPLLRDTIDTALRPEDAKDVYAQAETAIGRPGSLSIANAMIVGLSDAEGVTTTAAQRRITLCNSAAEWIADFRDDRGEQNGYWRWQSALRIKGLLKLVQQQADDHKKKESAYTHLQGKAITKPQFDSMMAKGQLPKDARFANDIKQTVAGAGPAGIPMPYADPYFGTIDIPTADRIDRDTADLKQDIQDKLTGKARGMDWQKFLQTHENKVKEDQQRLALLEQDHKAWLESDLFKHLYSVDFDDTALVDGLPYASCINNCLMGGPMTDKALDWWSGFLTQDPTLKHNLLVRALLGNQTTFFGWFAQLDQKAASYDELKGLLDVIHEAHEHGQYAGSPNIASGLAQSLLMIASSVAAARDKAGMLNDGLRERLKRLGLSLMGKSEPGLDVYVLRVPLGFAAQLWRGMAGVSEQALAKTAEVGQRKVKSLVLSGAIALDMAGSPKAADTLVDVYCWSQGKLSVQIGKVDGKYSLTTAKVTAPDAAPFSIKLTDETARQLTRDSMRLLRGARTGVLSAGSAFIQALLIGEAWKQLENGSTEDREAAAISLLTGGIGISTAFMEIGAGFAKQFEKTAAEQGLKMTAGYAAAFATFVGAVQAAIDFGVSLRRGDTDAAGAEFVQAIFFFIAAGAIFSATVAEAGAAAGFEIAGISALSASAWTGIGLVFVALGLLMAYVILLVKDNPPEAWAAQCIWGNASEKFPSQQRELVALNELVMGAEVDFAYNSGGTFWSDLWRNAAVAQLNQSEAWTGQSLTPQTKEAWLRLVLPKALKTRVGWLIQIHALHKQQGKQLVAQWGSAATPSTQGDDPQRGFLEAYHKEEPVDGNDEATALVISVKLDSSQYSHAYGTVRVAGQASDPLLQHGDLIVDAEHLTG